MIRKWLVHRWLKRVQLWAEGRILSGDIDLDDVVYRSRDAATALLQIWWKE